MIKISTQNSVPPVGNGAPTGQDPDPRYNATITDMYSFFACLQNKHDLDFGQDFWHTETMDP